MSATYRFSLLRANGWSRLGSAGALAVVFATPMMWALGVFGRDETTALRIGVFVLSGAMLCLSLGWAVGWAVRGFTVRLKDPAEDEDGQRRPTAAPHATGGHAPSAPRPAAR